MVPCRISFFDSTVVDQDSREGEDEECEDSCGELRTKGDWIEWVRDMLDALVTVRGSGEIARGGDDEKLSASRGECMDVAEDEGLFVNRERSLLYEELRRRAGEVVAEKDSGF